MNKSTQLNALLGLLVLALLGALYGPFLWNPIVFDDLYFFMQDDDGHQPISDVYFSPLDLRSLPYATLAWTKAVFGLDLIYFRLGNLVLHGAVALVLFGFLHALFSAISIHTQQAGLTPRLAAFFAALLFALHPVATYAAAYLVQRTILMATLFSLLAMWAYLHGSVQKKTGWLWWSVLLYYLAVQSKEHAVMLPALLLALTVLLHDDWRDQLKQRWGVFAALAVIAALVVLAKKNFIGSVYEINAAAMLMNIEGGLAYPLSVMTQTWLFFKYAFLWIFPNTAWMSIDMREPFAQSIFSPYLLAFVGFLAWGGGALFLLLKRGRSGLLGLGLLFPWLMFFTEFSSVRIQEVFVLYRSYLWVPGGFCLLPLVFYKVDRKTACFILGLIAVALVPLSMERLATLSHPLLLWGDVEKLVQGRTNLPGVDRIYYNRGTEFIHIDMPDPAIDDLKQAIALSPKFIEAHGNLGAAYFKKGDWKNAQAAFNRAIELALSEGKPVSPRHIHGRAQASENLGELKNAQADYRLSCQLAKRGCDKLDAGGSN